MVEKSDKRQLTMKVEPQRFEFVGNSVNFWIVTGTFAPSWYEDARREAKGEGVAAKRREVIFSICFLETYFTEWVRDDVLEKDYRKMSKYFYSKKPLASLWQGVTKKLKKNQEIFATQNFNNCTWKKFADLRGLRNWISHGVASRPIGSVELGVENQERLVAEMYKNRDNFNNSKNGDALKIAVQLVKELHDAAGEKFPMPDWID